MAPGLKSNGWQSITGEQYNRQLGASVRPAERRDETVLLVDPDQQRLCVASIPRQGLKIPNESTGLRNIDDVAFHEDDGADMIFLDKSLDVGGN